MTATLVDVHLSLTLVQVCNHDLHYAGWQHVQSSGYSEQLDGESGELHVHHREYHRCGVCVCVCVCISIKIEHLSHHSSGEGRTRWIFV